MMQKNKRKWRGRRSPSSDLEVGKELICRGYMMVVLVAVNRPSLSMLFVIIKRIGVVSFDFCSIVTQ